MEATEGGGGKGKGSLLAVVDRRLQGRRSGVLLSSYYDHLANALRVARNRGELSQSHMAWSLAELLL